METVIRYQKKITLFVSLLCLLVTHAYSIPAGSSNPTPYSAVLLQQALSRYTQIDKNGGWQKITLNKKHYAKGESADVVTAIKKRLQASGDLENKDVSPLFTSELENAVLKAQRRFGLKENGIVDAVLVSMLNVPVEARIRQLRANLDRMQSAPAEGPGRRIVVNIPEYKLHIYEGSSHVLEMNVVVGTEKNRTAIFRDVMTHVVFSPYWNVPPAIVQNEIRPAMTRSKNYLSRNGYEITGYEGGLPVIRQKPGKNNSLGLVKFLFPNEHDIYFHDTPAKSLFSQRVRAYSHGCVRLSQPALLAEYLLQTDPQWTSAKISQAMNAGKEQWVRLSQPVPVIITYFTAWIDHEGILNFRDDIYGYDKGLPVAVASQPTNNLDRAE
jgi:murein L,D-transpeptidase YcbB/YkuD